MATTTTAAGSAIGGSSQDTSSIEISDNFKFPSYGPACTLL